MMIVYPGTLNYSRAKERLTIQNEEKYLKLIGELFQTPHLYKISRIFANDLPYANISDMSTNDLLKTMISEYPAILKGMQLKNLHFQRKNANLISIFGNCPICNGLICIPITKDTESINIHITHCPYCVPAWIHVDPFDIEEYNAYYQKEVVPFLETSNKVLILEGDKNKAHFFIIKDHFKISSKKVGFFTSENYPLGNILTYPVIKKDKIPAFQPDCIVVTGQNSINNNLLEELTVVLHENNMDIPILFLDTPELAQKRGSISL